MNLGMEMGVGFAVAGAAESVPAFNELFMIAGQSNGMTFGVVPSDLTVANWTDNARVQMWDTGSQTFKTYTPSTFTNWGPEIAYAQRWLSDHPVGTLYLVKEAYGNTQLGSVAIYGQLAGQPSDWDPTSVGMHFANATAQITAAKAACGISDLNVAWLQGEADSLDATATAAYGANALALYTAIRAQWGNANTKIIAHMVSTLFASYAFANLLAQQRTVVSNNALNFIIDTRGNPYQADSIHLAPLGVLNLGNGIYDQLTAASVWWDKTTILDLDYANSRFMARGRIFSSAADMATAGLLGTASNGKSYGHLDGFGSPGLGTYTLLAEGDNSPVSPTGVQAQYLCYLDDGEDGVLQDELFAFSRQLVSAAVRPALQVYHASSSQVSTWTISADGFADSEAVKWAARMVTNNMNFAVNGHASTNDTACQPPSGISRLVIGSSLWTGAIRRVRLLGTAMNDAALIAATT